MVPPIRLWDEGVPNRRRADHHDPQLADARLARRRPGRRVRRLPAGRAPAGRAVRPVRARGGGGLLRRDRRQHDRTYRREILAKIPAGTWTWEDYAEHDGVDEPRLHTQRITLTKLGEDEPGGPRLILDFTGTGPQAKGPDQPLRRLRRRQLPGQVARADPAQPGRHARADGRARRERGHRRPDRDALPAAGHAAHPGLPRAHQRAHVRHPAAARRVRGRAGQGGRRADARRPGDDPLHRFLRADRRRGAVPHARGAGRGVGRPVLRRRRGHRACGARLPQPARPSSPRPGSRWWWSGSAWPWTPAGPGGSGAVSATRSSSGCGWTGTSCRSPTDRSCPAGA